VNLSTIQTAARASAAAYSLDRSAAMAALGERVIDFFPYAPNWFVAETPDYVVLCFRGSANLHDWFIDLDAIFVKTALGGKIHAGFSQCFALIQQQVDDAIKDFSKPLLITGHSLGGALAVHAAVKFLNQNKAALRNPLSAVVTFGQPRVGNGEFSKIYGAAFGSAKIQYLRVVNSRDLVPRVPLVQGRHFGEVSVLDQTGMRAQIPFVEKAVQDAAAIYQIGKFALARANVTANEIIGIDDLVEFFLREHSMNLYLQRLSRVSVSKNIQTQTVA
jgi:hypothetical protein